MTILIFFIILFALVLVHEFGHFIVAKKNGIRVDEFGFGFPPRLFSFKKGETTYSINALPFGGFVKIFGESPQEGDSVSPDASRSLVAKPKIIQASVLLAGIFFNLLLAWVLLSGAFVSGLPVASESKYFENAIGKNLVVLSILKNSPAESSGFLSGDKIISISDNKETLTMSSIESFQNFISLHPNQEITLSVNRGGELKDIKVAPRENLVGERAGIGVSIDFVGLAKLPIHKATVAGFVGMWDGFIGTVKAIAGLIFDSFRLKADLSNIAGPVGLVHMVGDAYKFGFSYLLFFTAMISISLAVINLVPFPALDGGRVLFLIIEKIKGSPIKPKIANMVNAIGFLLLIILMLVVTYNDVFAQAL